MLTCSRPTCFFQNSMLTQTTKFNRFVSTFKQNGISRWFRGPQIEVKHHRWERLHQWWKTFTLPYRNMAITWKNCHSLNRKITSPFTIHFPASYVSLLESTFRTYPKPFFGNKMIVSFLPHRWLAPWRFFVENPTSSILITLPIWWWVCKAYMKIMRLTAWKCSALGGCWGYCALLALLDSFEQVLLKDCELKVIFSFASRNDIFSGLRISFQVYEASYTWNLRQPFIKVHVWRNNMKQHFFLKILNAPIEATFHICIE